MAYSDDCPENFRYVGLIEKLKLQYAIFTNIIKRWFDSMKLSIVMLSIFSLLSAFEIRYGRGEFDMNMKIDNFMKFSKKLDIETISLVNSHDNIARSRFYIFYDVDIYRSDYVDSKIAMMEDMFYLPSKIIPKPFSDKVKDFAPFPSDVQVGGIDMNIGGGFDILESDEGYIGIGLATGLSTPYIYMKNGNRFVAPFMGAMSVTDTTITSWKSSLAVQGEYRFFKNFSIDGSALYGYQFARVQNGWIRSEIDMEGTISALDMKLKYDLGGLAKWGEGISLNAGMNSKSWESESVKVKVMDSILEKEVGSTMNINFDTVNYYMGIGYRF
jgi:hypothetical protein